MMEHSLRNTTQIRDQLRIVPKLEFLTRIRNYGQFFLAYGCAAQSFLPIQSWSWGFPLLKNILITIGFLKIYFFFKLKQKNFFETLRGCWNLATHLLRRRGRATLLQKRAKWSAALILSEHTEDVLLPFLFATREGSGGDGVLSHCNRQPIAAGPAPPEPGTAPHTAGAHPRPRPALKEENI
jgi:hypothetical protein